MENFFNKIINGNSLEVLKTLPDNIIDCCVTSPPYWGLRDYGHEEQLGSEEHFETFVTNLCNIFDEVKRVANKFVVGLSISEPIITFYKDNVVL